MAVLSPAAIVLSLPIGTRVLCALLVAGSLLALVLSQFAAPPEFHGPRMPLFYALVIVPGTSFASPWTLVTAMFVETSIWEFAISIVALPLAGRYFERLWGAAELIKFVLIVGVLSNVVAWFLAVLAYAVLRIESGIFQTQYHGMQAVQTAFLVALAQIIPEHRVQLFAGRVKIRVRDLPMAYVTLSNVMCLLGVMSPWILIQFGWLISWGYLRFFKVNDNGTRGDRSETFSLVQWFPPFMHKPVGMLSNFLYPIWVRLGVIHPYEYSALGDVELGVGRELGLARSNSGASSASNGAGARAEAERRRAMALKALDSRAPSSKQDSGSSAPGGGGGGSSSTGASEPPSLPTQNVRVPDVIISQASPQARPSRDRKTQDVAESEGEGDIGARTADDDDDWK